MPDYAKQRNSRSPANLHWSVDSDYYRSIVQELVSWFREFDPQAGDSLNDATIACGLPRYELYPHLSYRPPAVYKDKFYHHLTSRVSWPHKRKEMELPHQNPPGSETISISWITSFRLKYCWNIFIDVSSWPKKQSASYAIVLDSAVDRIP